MKYVCMGYWNDEYGASLSEAEMHAMMDACFEYDDELRAKGHFVGGEALQSPDAAVTLRWDGAKVTTTDGPFVETKEYLGGLLFLEARDLNHAIQLISAHPGVRMGPWEIRPTADLAAMIKASEARRAGTAD